MNVQDSCPVCRNADYKMIFSVKDYTVSLSMFDLVECTQCSHRFTREIPSLDEIGTYYKSDQYISHTDSNQGLLNKVYQFVRNIYKTRIKFRICFRLALPRPRNHENTL